MSGLRKQGAYLGLLVGLSALMLQFIISMGAYADGGYSIPVALLKFFSFFTILTNILLVLVYAGAVVRGKAWLSLFRRPITRATAAASIVLVGGFYHLFLAGVWDPEGAFLVADILLHTVTPIIYLIWFAGWNRTGTLKWAHLPRMLIYPLVYIGWVLVRGAIVSEYPYPTLDVTVLGYGQVAINLVVLLITFIVLSALAILIDRAVALGAQKN